MTLTVNGQELIPRIEKKKKWLNASSVNGLWSWMYEFLRLLKFFPISLKIIMPEFLESLNENYRSASPWCELGISVMKWFHVKDIKNKNKCNHIVSAFQTTWQHIALIVKGTSQKYQVSRGWSFCGRIDWRDHFNVSTVPIIFISCDLIFRQRFITCTLVMIPCSDL